MSVIFNEKLKNKTMEIHKEIISSEIKLLIDGVNSKEQAVEEIAAYIRWRDKQLTLTNVGQQRQLFYKFITWYNAKPNKNKEKMIYTDIIEEYLKI